MLGSMATFKAFQFTFTLLIVLLLGGAFIASALDNTPTCHGSDRCASATAYYFDKTQTVVGEKISLYESGIHEPIERCFIKDVPYKGKVDNGIVNPTAEDLSQLGYPECELKKK
jgi:hypothetical protein